MKRFNHTFKNHDLRFFLKIMILFNLLLFISCNMVTDPNEPQEPVPNPPTGVTVSKNSENYISLCWNSTPYATGYKIFRGSSCGNVFDNLANTNLTGWDDVNTEPAKWYYYQITAYSNAGESEKSDCYSGYKKGWRFDEISVYDPPNGIGFNFDLYSFGYKNQSHLLAIYAVYKSNNSYKYIPGHGSFYLVCFLVNIRPIYSESHWDNIQIYLNDKLWPNSWRNNIYNQYIKMRIYKYPSINSLNDPYYDETNYYRIIWSSNALGKPNILYERLSDEESEEIDNSIVHDSNLTQNNYPILDFEIGVDKNLKHSVN